MKNLFEKNNLFQNRMISFSKSFYRKIYPYNTIIFDSNAFIFKENKYIKIWSGDIDITLEGYILKEISKEIKHTIYLLPKNYSENELESIENICIWNTNEEIIEITKSYIKSEKNILKEKNKFLKIQKFKNIKKSIIKNKLINISNLKEEFPIQIPFPTEYFFEELNKFKDLYTELSNSKKVFRNKGTLYELYFKEYGYFSYCILENYLHKYFNLSENEIINPSSVWLSRKLNKKIRAVDFFVENLFNKNFKYINFGRYVTCNYCVADILYSDYNLNSFKDNILYIRSNYKKEK